MKHLIRNVCVAFFHFSGICALYRIHTLNKGPLVRVLVFHDVADRVWFASLVEHLVKQYNVITPLQFHLKAFDPLRINVLLTFDDGYQTWIDNCLPVLEAYDRKGLFFINSGLLDSAENNKAVSTYMKENLRIRPKQPLTWNGAELLVDKGHSIGGHSVSHKNLAAVDDATLQLEITEDKKRIELMLGVTLSDFAYPFGRKKNWNDDVQSEVVRASYTHIYTADTGFVAMAQPHSINRVCIEKNQSILSIRWWIEGGYDIFKHIA